VWAGYGFDLMDVKSSSSQRAPAAKRWPEAPRSTIFVDDVEPYIAVAAEMGMLPLRFMGPAALRADLRALGLLGGPAASGADGSDQT
jgi:hypothetical protein